MSGEGDGRLAGRVALITGAASGIGRATAELIRREGAEVCVVDVDRAAGESCAAAVSGHFVETDVGDAGAMQRAVEECTRALGGLDVAFLNAGVPLLSSEIDALDQAEYERIIHVNVNGVTYGMQASVAAMTRLGGGAIVATSSLAGVMAHAPDPVYAGTKHYVIGLMRGVAKAVADRGITVNCVCPGLVDTAILGSKGRAVIEETGFPMMPPEQISEAVLGLVVSGRSGEAWVCQPGRDPIPYAFRGVPGPRLEGTRVGVPPDLNYAV